MTVMTCERKPFLISSEYHVLHMMQNKHRKLTGQGTNKEASPCCPALGSSGLWTISKGASCCIVGKTTGKTSLLSSSSTFTFCISCIACISCISCIICKFWKFWIFCKKILSYPRAPPSACVAAAAEVAPDKARTLEASRWSVEDIPQGWKPAIFSNSTLIVLCTLATSTLSQGSLGLASVILQTTWST